MKYYLYRIMSSMIVLAISAPALAQVAITTSRCNEDLIFFPQKAQVIERWEWAHKCHAARFSPIMQFAYPAIQSFVDNWTQTEVNKPVYPVYIKEDASATWQAPRDRNAPCAEPPWAWKFVLCEGGCLLGNQLVLFEDGYYRASEALRLKMANIVTLAPSATSDNLRLQISSVKEYRTDVTTQPTNQYLAIATAVGTTIKVTPAHPLVNGEGQMVRASQLRIGDKLMHVSGAVHTIIRIMAGSIQEGVIGIQPITADETSSVFIAQGYLSGSALQQNRDLLEVNRYLFREQLDTALLVD